MDVRLIGIFILNNMVKLDVVADIGQLIKIVRYSEKNRPILIRAAAKRYLQWIRRRFKSSSGGAGNWDHLADSTIRHKEARGVAENPEAILSEFDELYNAIDVEASPSGADVGIFSDKAHTLNGVSISELAEWHQHGTEKMPARKIIVTPSNTLRRNMVGDVRNEYNKLIRRFRGGK